MDVRNVFNVLLTNQKHAQYRDHIYCKFSFQTVFYKSPNIYCCCPCGFENEFLSYISDTGDIDKETHDKILQNFLDGKCPHVDDSPDRYVRETSVYGAHIAAAVGTPDVLRNCDETAELMKTGIFQFDPFMVGVSKKNFRGMAQFYRLFIRYYRIMIHAEYYDYSSRDRAMYIAYIARRSNENTCITTIKCETSSIVEFCLTHRSLILLGGLIDMTSISKLMRIVESLESDQRSEIPKKLISLVSKLMPTNKSLGSDQQSEIQKELLNFLVWFAEGKTIHGHDLLTFCLRAISEIAMVSGKIKVVHQLLDMRLFERCFELGEDDFYHLGKQAIFYNQPELLKRILDKLHQAYNSELGEVCSILQREKCQRILLRHGVQTENISFVKRVKILYDVCDTVHNSYTQEIEALLLGLPKIDTFEICMLSSYIKESKTLDIRIIRRMLELGASIDSVDSQGNTILINLLTKMRGHYFGGDRAVLDSLLYENNFDVELNKTAVAEGLELDCVSETWPIEYLDLEGDYVTDAKLHGSVKLNHAATFCLNFCGPLLIECGFPYTKDTLLKYLDVPLQPCEHEYLRQCIDTTRSLKMSCRDSLRRHFKRNIHQFVESSEIPKTVKEFILLKPILVNKC